MASDGPSTAVEPVVPGSWKGGWRRRLSILLRIAVTVGALAYLLHKAGIRPIARHLAHADLSWLLAGYGVAGVSILLTVLQWQGLLSAMGLHRSYRRCLHLELAGDVFDAALPTSVGGDVMRAIRVSDQPDERVAGAASVLLRRLCNFPGMVVIMAVSLLATLDLSYGTRIRPYALVAVVVGICAVAVTFSPLLAWIGRRPRLQRGPVRAAVGKVLGVLGAFRGERKALLAASFRGIVLWFTVAISQWCFMRAVGVSVPFAYAALVVTVTTSLTMLPISLGGYGLREGAFSAFLAVGHLATTAQGVAVGVCLTAQTIGLGVFGIPFYLSLNRGRGAQQPEPALLVGAT